MELNKSTCKLIAELEYIIGSECHNPNAYDGWTGIEGCNYRYPVNIPDSDGKYIKVRNKITDTAFFSIDDIKPTTIQYMKYKFGTNELMIGQGIIKILEFLEARYGIQFNDLEDTKGQKK